MTTLLWIALASFLIKTTISLLILWKSPKMRKLTFYYLQIIYDFIFKKKKIINDEESKTEIEYIPTPKNSPIPPSNEPVRKNRIIEEIKKKKLKGWS